MTWHTIIFESITYSIFIYSVIKFVLYVLIGLFSMLAIKKYTNKNSFIDYKLLAVSPYAPSLSILAPAYNEGANIIENVRSLLSIYYNNLELIVINDGSKDNSLQQLIDAYDLIKIDYTVIQQIATKEVRGIYKSKNPIYKKLVVVDKVNGGKADALNVGINIASNNYIVCIDVDCVLEQDAMLKLMKPFLDTTEAKVIATGGVVRIANSCEIQHGRLLKVNLPKQYLPRMQVLEYIRAFLLGRMAWSRLNGLLLISGAFGAFDKEIAIKAGGYNPKTVGEDMELVVRMRRYMEELNLPYKVDFIPDPLCWTEAPANYKILSRQRNRWTRGTIETLALHKKLFFNPRYGLLGMLSYPYWFFFEMCAPGIEAIGMVAFLVMAFLNIIYWQTFFAFLAFIISFGYLYSTFAIFMEARTYNQYRRRTDVMKLLLTAITEPFVFHPFVVWSCVRGYVDKIRNKSHWGEMTRQGFNSTPPAVVLTPELQIEQGVVADIKKPINRQFLDLKPSGHFLNNLKTGVQQAAIYSLILIGCMLIIKTYELIKDVQLHGTPANFSRVITFSYLNELSFGLYLCAFSVLLFTPLFLLHKKTAHIVFIIFSVSFVVIHAALAQYFLETLVPLGADLFNYSFVEINQIVRAANSFSPTFFATAFLALLALISIFTFIPGKMKFNQGFSFSLIILLIAGCFSAFASSQKYVKPGGEFSNNLSLNKSAFFYSSTLHHYLNFTTNNTGLPNNYPTNNTLASKYIDEANYPFLQIVDTSTNVLSPFFNKQAVPPNIVFIVVEGLGRAFSNKDAYLGSFTPFLDSLSGKSLYWSNFLSAGGRTFAMLPSIFGSLPYTKNGFSEMGNKMPAHLSLLNILKKDGYTSNFIYGGDATFDNMNSYLQMSSTNVIDKKSFAADYKTMPAIGGYSWGYGDEEVFKKYNEVNNTKQPYCNIVLTLSTHNPFLVLNQDKYLSQFEEHMKTLGFNEGQKKEHRFYKNQYSSIMYADNAVRNFINSYSLREDFSNTIFIITGDHRMPEIPMTTKIDRYHVPLIIYSPLLKRSKTFTPVSSHLDITPSLLSFLGHQYNFEIPAKACWLGSGLDTATSFRNIHAYPLKQTKNDLIDYIMDDYLLNGNDLYKMSNNMNLELIENESQKKKMQYAFALFQKKNNQLINGASLFPDSLLIK